MKQLLLVLFAALVFSGVHAQLTNNGIFYVGSTSVLYVGANFTNNSSATYQNDGTVYFTGNFINNQAGLPAGAGTTVFNGTVAQSISGIAPFRCLNITLNNAAGLTLTNRMAIGDGTAGVLTFTSGRITSGTNTQDVYFYPGSSYTGFDATHHIIGYTTKSGSTGFDFPIGDGTHTADLVIGSLTAGSDFQVLYTGSGYGNYPVTAPIIAHGVFIGEWWDLARTAGSASAQVSLKWNDARKSLNHSSPATLVVAHFTGGSWTSAGGTSSNASGSTTGTVGASNALSSFSPFTFGSTTVSLPITLGAFTAEDQNCQADLRWSTTLESDAAGFNVQQSTDGINFNTVATVKANDTASAYHVTVKQPARLAYYRLQLNDLDGYSSYSGVDVLNLTCLPAAQVLEVFPNPVTSGVSLQARLTSADAKGTAHLQIYDGGGRQVLATSVTVNGGVNTYNLPVAGLAKGIYMVAITGEGWRSDAITFAIR